MKKLLSLLGLLLLSPILILTQPAQAANIIAGLLPNGQQLFVDANGNPLAGGSVTFYIPSTTTFKNTWKDPFQSVLNTNPVILNGAGRATIYGNGQYREVVKDSLGNTIWDDLTYGNIPPSSTFGTQTSIASATVTDIGTVGTNNALITGTTTIVSFGTGADTSSPLYFVQFANSLTLTYNATSMKLLGGASQVVAAGSSMILQYLGNGNWQQIQNISGGYNADIVLGPNQNYTSRIINNQQSTDYSLLSTDRNKLVTFSLASAASTATFLSAATAGTGYQVIVMNLYSSSFSLTTAVASGNGFFYLNGTNVANLVLAPGESATFTSSGNAWLVTGYTRQPTTVQNGFANLRVVTPDAGALSNVFVDQLAVQATNFSSTLLSSISVTCNFATSGVNGLDTGPFAANSWYYEYVIYNPTSQTTACLGSLSSTAPTMPTGYTFKARVGALRTKGGTSFYGTRQFNKIVQYTTNPLPVMASGAAGSVSTPTWVAIATGAFVPATAGRIRGVVSGSTGGGSIILAPNPSYLSITDTSNRPPIAFSFSGVAAGLGGTQFDFVLESSNIYWADNLANGYVACFGWEDNL